MNAREVQAFWKKVATDWDTMDSAASIGVPLDSDKRADLDER